MVIDKYTGGKLDEELLKEVFLTKVPSDVRRLVRMHQLTPTTKLARMVNGWVTSNEDAQHVFKKQMDR